MSQKNKIKNSTRTYKDSILLLKRLFAQYSFKDIAESLLASELWLPNRASGIKHKFTWGVLASMNEDDFSNKKQTSSKSDFIAFLQTLYSLLPEFPMLEDFTPQPDWGDIRVTFNGHTKSVFYGAEIERITDFINAFEIRYYSCTSILKDMENALKTQSLFLNTIDKNIAGSTKYIEPGHLSVPTFEFKTSILKSIKIINQNQQVQKSAEKYSTSLSTFALPKTESEFGNAIMRGSFQQHLFICANKTIYPVSLRNFASIIFDYWNNQTDLQLSQEKQIKGISKLINENIESFIPGPSILYKKNKDVDILYPSMFTSAEKLFVPIPIEIENIEQAETIKQNIIDSFEQLDTLEFFNLNLNHVISLSDTYRFNDNNIKILFVLMDVSGENSFLPSSDDPAYLISLPDFVTLVTTYEKQDSIYDILNFGSDEYRFSPFTGVIDKLGAYKDSNTVLVEGTNSPDYMTLAPNYGCDWRYQNLLKFWESAPKYFPIKHRGWECNTRYDGISSIVAKSTSDFSWFTQIGQCELHFICSPKKQKLDVNNFRVFALAAECITDALKQREKIILDFELFQQQSIIVFCQADLNYLVNNSDAKVTLVKNSVFTEWLLPKEIHSNTRVKVSLNLNFISEELNRATNASFQARCVEEFVAYLSDILKLPLPANLLHTIHDTSSWPARVVLETSDMKMSLPEIPNYRKASLKDFKVARKELAFALQALKVSPGKYELQQAKQIIDNVRDSYRDHIHTLLKKFEKHQLLTICVEQHDRLINKHHHKQERLKISLRHEVNFDRELEYAKSVEDFTRDSKNYRYLIEYCVGMPSNGNIEPKLDDILNIFGKVDWLITLYSASDILHNDIEVGGISISEDYVPEVFYSNQKKEAEKTFRRHDGSLRLGKNINHRDELRVTDKEQFDLLQNAFEEVLGFRFSLMLEVLEHLSMWASVTNKEPAYFYQSTTQEVTSIIANSLKEENVQAVEKAINFLILDSDKTKTISGKTTMEPDVPIWEHYKRPYRYTVRPIISMGENSLVWGSGNAYKSHLVWGNDIANGYLPFDINSKPIHNALREVKAFLEKKLEIIAYEITSRFTSYCISGIDFKRRFPKQGFEDVGDYDVLAYWPEKNLWLTIECKYIQPTFSFKDSRRLRDKMFDSSKGKSHLCKIAKRRGFLTSHSETIRTLLGWPNLATLETEEIRELYVSKDTYWWMFATPYSIPTEFVQINLLENWFKKLVE